MSEIHDLAGRVVTPEIIVNAYCERCFPMSDDRDSPLNWYRPEDRAVIDWQSWKVPRSMRKQWNKAPYRLSHDTAFAQVIAACADRESTWIGHDIENLYMQLHDMGIAHSVEAWNEHDELVGGVYGLSLGAAFCGESMFHRAPDASKLCVMYLVRHLQDRGFRLLDCQQQTPHMQRFGAYLIDDQEYQEIFEAALVVRAKF